MTENHRGRYKQSYNKTNHSSRGKYRRNGDRYNYNNQQRDRSLQYDDIDDERPSFSHFNQDLNNVDASMNLESWRSSGTVKRYFGIGFTSASTVDKQFNTLSITEQQQQDKQKQQQQKRPHTIDMDDNNEVGFYFDSTPTDVKNNPLTNNNNTKKNSENDNYMNLKENNHHNNKKNKIKKNKMNQQGRRIILGDDIHISLSSEEEEVHRLDRNNKSLNGFHRLEEDSEDDDDNGDDDVNEVFNDYIKNTDPDTWQQFNQWANNRPVDNQPYGQIHDHDDDDDNQHPINNGMNDYSEEDSEDDDDILDFGLSDSDDERQPMHAGMHHYYPSYYTPMQSYSQPISKRNIPSKIDHYNKNNTAYQLERIDRRLQLFIMDGSRDTYKLPGMSDYCRRLVQGLTTIYRLKLTPEASTDGKIYPILRKSPKTCIPNDRKAIDKHIYKKRSVEKAKRKMKKKPKENQPKVSAKPAAGKIVGQYAAPIASNNIGHKLMSAMGWKEGESLGNRNDGIINPIEVKILSKRKGLGS